MRSISLPRVALISIGLTHRIDKMEITRYVTSPALIYPLPTTSFYPEPATTSIQIHHLSQMASYLLRGLDDSGKCFHISPPTLTNVCLTTALITALQFTANEPLLSPSISTEICRAISIPPYELRKFNPRRRGAGFHTEHGLTCP